jgi:hypothetical protein
MRSLVEHDAPGLVRDVNEAWQAPLPARPPPSSCLKRTPPPAVVVVTPEPPPASPWLVMAGLLSMAGLCAGGTALALALLLLRLTLAPPVESPPLVTPLVPETGHIVEVADPAEIPLIVRTPPARQPPAPVHASPSPLPPPPEPVTGSVVLTVPTDLPIASALLQCKDGTSMRAVPVAGRVSFVGVPGGACQVRFSGAVPTRVSVQQGDTLRCRFDGLSLIGCLPE